MLYNNRYPFNEPRKPKGYKVGNTYVNPDRIQNTGDYMAILTYLKECSNIRSHLCYSCSVSYAYDKNNVKYRISRGNTLEEAKKLVEEIRKINEQ